MKEFGPSTCRTCSRTRGAPPCRGWRPGTRSTAARGWRTKGSPRTPSWSRRRAARCWARGRSLAAFPTVGGRRTGAGALHDRLMVMLRSDAAARRVPRGFKYQKGISTLIFDRFLGDFREGVSRGFFRGGFSRIFPPGVSREFSRPGVSWEFSRPGVSIYPPPNSFSMKILY